MERPDGLSDDNGVVVLVVDLDFGRFGMLIQIVLELRLNHGLIIGGILVIGEFVADDDVIAVLRFDQV